MVNEVAESFAVEMLEKLQSCAGAVEMNGSASYMLAQELAALDKALDDLTLGDLQAVLECVEVRYHQMAACLDKRLVVICRRALTKGICVEGRMYLSAELAGLVGKKIAIELWPASSNSLTLLASHCVCHFQIHTTEPRAVAGPISIQRRDEKAVLPGRHLDPDVT